MLCNVAGIVLIGSSEISMANIASSAILKGMDFGLLILASILVGNAGFILEKIDKRVSNRARYFYTNLGGLLATLMIVWGASSWWHMSIIDLSHISMKSVVGFVYLVFGVGFVAGFLNIYMTDRYGTVFSSFLTLF